MDPRIASLKSTTFCGRRLTRRQIADVQETVAAEPQRACQDGLRAPRLDHPEGRLPGRSLHAHAGELGGIRGPDPAGEAEHDPRSPHADHLHRALRPEA